MRHLGYVDGVNRPRMLARGTCAPIPLGPADMTEHELRGHTRRAQAEAGTRALAAAKALRAATLHPGRRRRG